MRHKLRTFFGKRLKYTARVQRFGTRVYKGATMPTLVLCDVKDERGHLASDHCWFNLTPEFEAARLEVGDTVSFCATSKAYKKGFESKTLDYKLSHPVRIEKTYEPSAKDW